MKIGEFVWMMQVRSGERHSFPTSDSYSNAARWRAKRCPVIIRPDLEAGR